MLDCLKFIMSFYMNVDSQRKTCSFIFNLKFNWCSLQLHIFKIVICQSLTYICILTRKINKFIRDFFLVFKNTTSFLFHPQHSTPGNHQSAPWHYRLLLSYFYCRVRLHCKYIRQFVYSLENVGYFKLGSITDKAVWTFEYKSLYKYLHSLLSRK